MPSTLALLLLLGAPAQCAVTDGRDPASIPKLNVPEPPEWEDIEHPEFEPYPISEGLELLDNAILEQFDGSPEEILKRWRVSKAEREAGVPYEGVWDLMEPLQLKGFNNDFGLVLVSENNAGAIARKLDAPIDATSGTKPLVVQYEVKNQVRLRCGGGYIKVLPTTNEPDYSSFSNETPYLIMFGPDKCGTTDKVHLILRRNGVEHHLVQPPSTKAGLLSALYTLIIQPNLDFEIRIDGAVYRQGNLLDELEFEPPLVPPKTILDESETKPEEWDDREYVPSPYETEKPEDWDESEPRMINDPTVVKPANWREDIPLYIKDPSARKPEAWDDEEDGEYLVPEILNPLCQNLDASIGEGCGEWKAPLVKNPNFKGQWTQPLIPNPNYQGLWRPQRVANPDFNEKELIEQLSKMDSDVGGLGFEILTVQGMSMFTNIYVGNSVRDAENIGNATFVPKFMLETESQKRALEAYQKQREEAENGASSGASSESNNDESTEISKKADIPWYETIKDTYLTEIEYFRAEPFHYAVDMYNEFITLFRINKVEAVKQYPVSSLVAFVVFHILSMVIFGVLGVVKYAFTGKSVKSRKSTTKSALKPSSDPQSNNNNQNEGDPIATTSVASTEAKTATTTQRQAAK